MYYVKYIGGNSVIPFRLGSNLFSTEKIEGWYTYITTVLDSTAPTSSTDFYVGDIVKCSLDNETWVTEDLIMWDPHNPWAISIDRE